MRKVIGSLFLISVLLIGCTNKIDDTDDKSFSEDANLDDLPKKIADTDPFVKLELYSASAGTYLDHFPKIITVSNDGSVYVFTKERIGRTGNVEMKVEDDAPTIEKNISLEEVKEIKEVIEKNRFFSIPKDVIDYDVMDGEGSKITVYEKERQRKVGGENSSNKQYNAIEATIFNLVKNDYDEWVKETEDYLFELNE